MSARDPELTRLLIGELERHLPALEAGVVGGTPAPVDGPRPAVDGMSEAELLEAARRSVHALKGSAGLAGEREFASNLQRVERRLREGDKDALREAAEQVRVAIRRLGVGANAAAATFPEPPDDLVATPLDPRVRAQYTTEIADRLTSMDEALGPDWDPVDAATVIYRHVHTIKGAASAVGDEPMSWFCHGLEEWLKAGTGSREAALAALQEVARWRAVLGGLLEDPASALLTLRAATRVPRHSSMPASGRTTSSRPDDDGRPPDEPTIRVAAASVDRLLDQLASIGAVQEGLAARGERSREQSRALRVLRADLGEALRLIGPPRPWGAPALALRKVERAAASLATLVDELDRAANDIRANEHALREAMKDGKRHLAAMRQSPLRLMFARLATAMESEARRADRIVVVRTGGADETVDRRIAEALVEPCLTLARNAVAHGIESPAVRESLGKSPVGTITLSARKAGNRLFVTIVDDGAGVDVGKVRQRAVEAGAVTASLADAADDNTLLALLFLPGFSTRESTDLLAGRGIGLDIALGAVQRLGGAIRLSSRHGLGFEARVEVPIESGITNVLWVRAGGAEHAIVAAHARAVRRNDASEDTRVAHLAACLEARPNERAEYVVELDMPEEEGCIAIGVDGVGRTEEVLIRPLTPLVAGMGPFAGAIVRGNGSLRLALDVYALAPRVRALGRVPDGRISDFPSNRPGQLA